VTGPTDMAAIYGGSGALLLALGRSSLDAFTAAKSAEKDGGKAFGLQTACSAAVTIGLSADALVRWSGMRVAPYGCICRGGSVPTTSRCCAA
jgi:hypothetical protein